jgi:hypothetical protein
MNSKSYLILDMKLKKSLSTKLRHELRRDLQHDLDGPLEDQIRLVVDCQLDRLLWSSLENRLHDLVFEQIENQLALDLVHA